MYVSSNFLGVTLKNVLYYYLFYFIVQFIVIFKSSFWKILWFSGIGPAIFGFVFYMFNMDLTQDDESTGHIGVGPQFPVPNIRLQPFNANNNKLMAPSRNSSAERIYRNITVLYCFARNFIVVLLLEWI